MTSHEDAGGRWLDDTAVPTFFIPVAGEQVVAVFLRAGEFDESLPLTGMTEVALRAAIAALPSGHAVRELRVGGTVSTIVLGGDEVGIRETLRSLAGTMAEPDGDRIEAELRRARSKVDARDRGLRERHFVKRFGPRGPGTTDFPRYGAHKAGIADIVALSARVFTVANTALLMLAREPFDVPFEPPSGPPVALPRPEPIDALELPSRARGPAGGVSASMDLPRSLTGRIAFKLLTRRLEALGALGDLTAGVEQYSAEASLGTVAAPVGEAFVDAAGAAIVEQLAVLSRTPPTDGELRDAWTAWVADTTATPYGLGWFVVGEMLLGSRLESRGDLVDRLWDIEPADVTLTAELMAKTTLLLLPAGVEIDAALIAPQPPPTALERVPGRVFRPYGAAFSWDAAARGTLVVGEHGVSQIPGSGKPFRRARRRTHVAESPPGHTVRFDDVALLVDYDDGVLLLVGSRSWLQVEPRHWRHGDVARAAILERVPPDRAVPVPKGEQAIAASAQAIAAEHRQARRERIVTFGALAAVFALLGVLALIDGGGSDRRATGNCARIETGHAVRVGCSSSDAQARLLATTSPFGGPSQCPPATDRILALDLAGNQESGCLRMLGPPHRGDPGRGGGILLAGDCIADPSARPPGFEVACGTAGDWATVAMLTVDRLRCPPRAVDYVDRRGPLRQSILCLARGPGVLTRGDCLADDSFGPLPKVPCGSPQARLRVATRVRAARLCPARTQPALAPRALPQAAFACLRQL
jgi:hypothetical protein